MATMTLRGRVVTAVVVAAMLISLGARFFAQHKLAYWIVAPTGLIAPLAVLAGWIHPWLMAATMLLFDFILYAVAVFLVLTLLTKLRNRSEPA